MSLAQVIHKITTDDDFANQWKSNPEKALAQRGLKLSQEELAFLSKSLKRGAHDEGSVSLAEIASLWSGWHG